MKGEQEAVVSPRCWLCLERLSSNAQHPLGVSLPSQEIRSDLSGLSVLFGGSLLHFSLVEANSVWTSRHLHFPRTFQSHV